jgi:Golgi SNAP receptor complex protein 2
MARREIVPQIREKALARVERFRKDLDQYKQEYKRVQVRA